MNRRRFVSLAPLAGIALLPLRKSNAGGWASVEIVDRPEVLEAGKSMVLWLSIKQHGITPIDIDPLVISGSNAGSGETIEETATKAEGEGEGNYTVALTFPSEGTWRLEGSPGGFPSFDMGPVEVGRTAGATSLTAPGGVAIVDIAGGMGGGNFEPGQTRVPAGTLVVWANNSVEGHTIVIDEMLEGSGLIGPGAAYAMRFDEPGIYRYSCGPHPNMTGEIEVI